MPAYKIFIVTFNSNSLRAIINVTVDRYRKAFSNLMSAALCKEQHIRIFNLFIHSFFKNL